MSDLRTLQSGLRRVRRYRAAVRKGSAIATVGAVVVASALAAMALDVAMSMGRLERVILDVALVGLWAWATRKWLLPALAKHESDAELALLVERNQGVSSDLIAALQFSDASRSQFGSADLRGAIVACVSEFTQGLNFLEGFDARQLKRRAGLAGGAIALLLAVALLWPAHLAAFGQRLALLNVRYPTATRIVSIDQPGEAAAYGQPVPFEIRLGGDLPEEARASIRVAGAGAETSVSLHPSATDPALYTGKLDHIYDDLEYTVYAGDTWSEPRRIRLVPLPRVDLTLSAEQPAYAAGRFEPRIEGWRATVLRGSSLSATVTADKPLTSAHATIGGQTVALRRQGEAFVLDPTDTPLAKLTESMHFTVQVRDADGLGLEEAILVTVSVRNDELPRVAAAAVSHYVLPTAKPTVTCAAADDFGIERVEMVVTIVPSAGERREERVTLATPSDHPVRIDRTWPVDLAAMDLEKHDRVEVVVEAVDGQGQVGKSGPVEFLVTDAAGLLRAIEEGDQQLNQRLDEIIEAQLRTGGVR